MEPMTKRMINACNLDAGAVDEYGTDEYHFQRDVLHWNLGEKVVFESTKEKWADKKNDDDWDFPKAELADILRGDLSDGVKVYVHFKDSDGDDRYGELTSIGTIETARKYFGEQGTPMEYLA